MPASAFKADAPFGSCLSGVHPEILAAHGHRASVPGLAWLDSAVAGPGARSLVAAVPEKIVCGEAWDWPAFDARLQDFRRAWPDAAAVGWVEYDGRFQFGFYPQPLLFDHAVGRWSAPGGEPAWSRGLGADSIVAPPAWRGGMRFTPAMTAREFRWRVASAQEHIAAGDIYQVNLAHRLSAPWPADADPLALYLALRKISPAPQAAFLALDERRTVLCASPEEFLAFDGRRIRTRPIKGTRPRGASPGEDAAAARELLASPKERAELLMITDLLRNDLGQFCEYGSVRVRELFRVERFAQVLHLVSTVEGRLRADVSHAAALRICLPGGSITGAPKRRAREIIAKLEPVPRGLYTGAIGAFLGGGESRFNIVIRSLMIEGDTAHFHVGAGIVADSDPQREWEETLHKAAGILQAASLLA